MLLKHTRTQCSSSVVEYKATFSVEKREWGSPRHLTFHRELECLEESRGRAGQWSRGSLPLPQWWVSVGGRVRAPGCP